MFGELWASILCKPAQQRWLCCDQNGSAEWQCRIPFCFSSSYISVWGPGLGSRISRLFLLPPLSPLLLTCKMQFGTLIPQLQFWKNPRLPAVISKGCQEGNENPTYPNQKILGWHMCTVHLPRYRVCSESPLLQMPQPQHTGCY